MAQVPAAQAPFPSLCVLCPRPTRFAHRRSPVRWYASVPGSAWKGPASLGRDTSVWTPRRCSWKCHGSKDIVDRNVQRVCHTEGCSLNVYPGQRPSSYVPHCKTSKMTFRTILSCGFHPQKSRRRQTLRWMERLLLPFLSRFLEASVIA